MYSLGRMAVASGLMGIVTYVVLQFLQLQNNDQSFVATFPKFMTITLVSFAVYVWLSYKFKLRESEPVIAKIEAILFGRRR